MTEYHQELSAGRWAELSFAEQMANIGSEVGRTISWKNKHRMDFSQRAFERALELLGLTIASAKTFPRLKELTRVKEALIDHFVFDNSYQSTDQQAERYFLPFNYAARVKTSSS